MPHFLALALLQATTTAEIEALRAAAAEGETVGALWRAREAHYDRSGMPDPRYARRPRFQPGAGHVEAEMRLDAARAALPALQALAAKGSPAAREAVAAMAAALGEAPGKAAAA